MLVLDEEKKDRSERDAFELARGRYSPLVDL